MQGINLRERKMDISSTFENIIIVDDDAEIGSMIAETLQLSGKNAESVSSAKECIALCTGKSNTLLIVDLLMPDTDGIELIDLLADSNIMCSIIFMSGGSSQNLSTAKTLANVRGFDVRGCIQKPFSATELFTLM